MARGGAGFGWRSLLGAACLIVTAGALWPVHAAGPGAAHISPPHEVPPVQWALPFAVLLLLIAVMPLLPATRHWWEHNRNKLLISLTLGGLVLLYYGTRRDGFHHAQPGWPSVEAVARHAVLDEFVPFFLLLLSLYVISGGLQLKGDLLARPIVNTGFLATGALLASLIGTTGASMLLIRPLLQTNADRRRVRHTVLFFIFLVSNIGGSLLPIGDPPLFLGYLRGVPFLWTLRLLPAWALTVGILLVGYYAWERVVFRHEDLRHRLADTRHFAPLRLRGGINLAWLLLVVLTLVFVVPGQPLPGTSQVAPRHLRELILLGLSALSLATTPRGLRAETEFNYHPILEVGALFLGIFLTMQVPLEILQARGSTMGLTEPLQFLWATGMLSSVLDNAPTYLVFLEIARSITTGEGPTVPLADGGVAEPLLVAISLGAVFMGANTYIGNGPNFMVKAIAERQGVPMPSFFGYTVYSGLILLPAFALVGWLFCT